MSAANSPSSSPTDYTSGLISAQDQLGGAASGTGFILGIAILFGCLTIILAFAGFVFLRHWKRWHLVSAAQGAPGTPPDEGDGGDKGREDPSQTFVIIVSPDDEMAVGYKVSEI